MLWGNGNIDYLKLIRQIELHFVITVGRSPLEDLVKFLMEEIDGDAKAQDLLK